MSTSRKGRPRKRRPSRPAAPPRAEQTPPLKEKAGGGRSRAILVGFAAVVIATAAVYFLRDAGEPPPAGKQVPVAERGRIRFENRQATSGIDFVLNNGTTNDKPVIDSTLGGVAVFDYNNDGRLDVFFTNGAHIPSLKKTNPSFYNRLYENQGGGTFADVTEAAGLAGSGYSMGAAVGDYDNDGRPDLYVTGVNVNALYRNDGKGAFTDVTDKTGVTGRVASGRKPWSVASAWVDYDSDGHLDLFVVNYLDWSFAKNQLCGDPGKRLSCSPALYDGLPNMLYRNNGDGTFADVSAAAGIAVHIGKGMSAAVADYNDDGRPDIFVTNDSERNFLFRNVDGKRFEEVAVEAAVAFTEDGIPVSSMGLDFRDLDNDGRPDVTITALTNETYPLFMNEGGGLFVDATYSALIGLSSNTMSGWGNGVFDFDGDGWKDIFTANSHVSENLELYREQKYKLPNAVFQNGGNGTFEDVSGAAGLETAAAHRGTAFGDLDGDGRIDVVVSAIGEPAEILYNVSEPARHWILLRLIGSKSNRDGIGTRIKLTTESGAVQYNHATTAVGYAGASDQRVHFGLGEDARIREIELHWPGGAVQVFEDVAVDQILEVREP